MLAPPPEAAPVPLARDGAPGATFTRRGHPSVAGGNDGKTLVLQATDIVELVRQTLPDLKKRGKDWVGRCPFHQEKTPSFSVSPSKQFFYCYGCKVGGDAITFVMKRDRI